MNLHSLLPTITSGLFSDNSVHMHIINCPSETDLSLNKDISNGFNQKNDFQLFAVSGTRGGGSRLLYFSLLLCTSEVRSPGFPAFGVVQSVHYKRMICFVVSVALKLLFSR